MSFAWVEYLAVAEGLLQQRGTLADAEACCRATISRAYYAAFCAARNHARDVEGLRLTQTGEDHREVLRHYRRPTQAGHQEVGALLFRLRRHRTQADYADTMPGVVSRAYTACQRARRVLRLLETLQP